MDKLQRDYTIDSTGPLPNYWEVTPVQKERVYTESEVIALLNWMQDIHCRYTQKWMFGDVSSVEVLEQYNNQKQ